MIDFRKTTNPHCKRRSQQERGKTFSELVVEDHSDNLSSLFHRNRKIEMKFMEGINTKREICKSCGLETTTISKY